MSSNQVSKSQLKANALEFFRHVEPSGQSVIVTDQGKPTLEVRPCRDATRSPHDMLRGSVVRYGRPTDPIGEGDWDAAP